MASEVRKEEFEEIPGYHEGNATFERKIANCVSGDDILRLLHRYVKFNQPFAGAVLGLASQIYAQQDLFRDPQAPEYIADRSADVAGRIHYAAIDEFRSPSGDSMPHRRLAQILLQAASKFYEYQVAPPAAVACINQATRDAIEKVCHGYGARRQLDPPDMFRAMGFHIGSELLADQEFNILARKLLNKFPSLVNYLKNTRVPIDGQQVKPYTWIDVHTTVEAVHRDAAIDGANMGLQFYAGETSFAEVKRAIFSGFRDFLAMQNDFMNGLSE